MSDIVVHGVPGSPFVRSVEMGLHEKGAAYRLQAIILVSMRHRQFSATSTTSFPSRRSSQPTRGPPLA